MWFCIFAYKGWKSIPVYTKAYSRSEVVLAEVRILIYVCLKPEHFDLIVDRVESVRTPPGFIVLFVSLLWWFSLYLSWSPLSQITESELKSKPINRTEIEWDTSGSGNTCPRVAISHFEEIYTYSLLCLQNRKLREVFQMGPDAPPNVQGIWHSMV